MRKSDYEVRCYYVRWRDENGKQYETKCSTEQKAVELYRQALEHDDIYCLSLVKELVAVAFPWEVN